MNHQEIADQIGGLRAKYVQARAVADAPIDAEKAQLQAACGEIGHIYRVSPYSSHEIPVCAICDHWERMVLRVPGAIVVGAGTVALEGSTAANALPSQI